MCISLEGDTFYFTACVHFTVFLLVFGYIIIIIIIIIGKNDTLFLIHWFIAYSIYTVVYMILCLCALYSHRSCLLRYALILLIMIYVYMVLSNVLCLVLTI